MNDLQSKTWNKHHTRIPSPIWFGSPTVRVWYINVGHNSIIDAPNFVGLFIKFLISNKVFNALSHQLIELRLYSTRQPSFATINTTIMGHFVHSRVGFLPQRKISPTLRLINYHRNKMNCGAENQWWSISHHRTISQKNSLWKFEREEKYISTRTIHHSNYRRQRRSPSGYQLCQPTTFTMHFHNDSNHKVKADTI